MLYLLSIFPFGLSPCATVSPADNSWMWQQQKGTENKQWQEELEYSAWKSKSTQDLLVIKCVYNLIFNSLQLARPPFPHMLLQNKWFDQNFGWFSVLSQCLYFSHHIFQCLLHIIKTVKHVSLEKCMLKKNNWECNTGGNLILNIPHVNKCDFFIKFLIH